MEDLTKGKNDVRRRLLDLLLRLAPSSTVPVSEESVEVSDVILRASDLARALADEAVAKARAAVAVTAGGEVGAEVDGEIGRRVRGEDGCPKGGNLYRGAD